MKCKYGYMSDEQISKVITYIRKQIFFLLLCVDHKTKDKFQNVNVELAFKNVLCKLTGLSNLLFSPVEIVSAMCLLESALVLYKSDNFDFKLYRKYVLDAGAIISTIKGGEDVCQI